MMFPSPGCRKAPSTQDTLYGHRACTTRALLTPRVNPACAALAPPPPEHTKSPCGNLSQGPCVSVAEGEGCEPPEGLNGFQGRRMQPLCLPYRLVRRLRPVRSGHAVRAQGLHDPGLAYGGNESRLRGPRPLPRSIQKAPAAICRRGLVFLWRKERDVTPRRASTVFRTAACSRSAILP